jgi:uncharacterized protein YndB with AHSA1/START domain
MAEDTTVDLVLRLERALEHPVEKVWPYLLHWNLWVDNKEFIPHRVAGQLDTEGEVIAVNHFDAEGRMDSMFFIKVVKIIPNKQLIYKILSPEHSFDPKTGVATHTPQSGYEVFNVYHSGGKTVVALDVLAELKIAGIGPEEALGVATKYRDDTEKNWNHNYFPRLEKLLAEG